MPMSGYTAWYGRDEAPPERIHLRAGPLTAVLENGDLRRIRLGAGEVARRIYVAVRDVNWDTIPGEIDGLRLQHDEDSFDVTYSRKHRRGSIAVDLTVSFVGAPDGTISCSMDGVTRDEFRFYRIGFCVLHPARSGAGSRYRASGEAGAFGGRLPVLVEPPRIANGAYQPLLPAYSTLELEQTDGLDVRFDFEGELFEMEDERSWTDASFKTFCPPYAAGIRSTVEGREIHQKIKIGARARPGASFEVPAPVRAPRPSAAIAEPVALTLGPAVGRGLPLLGLGCSSDGAQLSEQEAAQLRILQLDHLRVELRLWEPSYPRILARAAREARELGCDLELALFVTDDGERELGGLAARLTGISVARVLVFHEPEANLRATDVAWVRLARSCLATSIGGASVGGGTNGNFAELLETLQDTGDMDVVSYTANPQVHASDERSIVENVETLAVTVATAQSHAPGCLVAVSRLTLKPPFATYAIEPPSPTAPDEPPSHVDQRQMSLFGAGWALGSIKYLAESRVSSLTMCETVGGAGVMERARRSGAPALRFSEPGMVFPMYHVLADLAAWPDGELIDCVSPEPASAIGLARRIERGLVILVANLGPEDRRITLGPLPAGRTLARILDARSADVACRRPRQFRETWSSVESGGGVIALELAPYATAALRHEAD